MRQRNIIAAIVLIAFGIAYGVLTARLPTRAIENATDPSFFPWINTGLLLGLAAALLVLGLRTPAGGTPRGRGPAESSGRAKAITALVISVIYLAVLPALGFLIANILGFGALMAVYGERRPVWLAVGAIGVPVALFFLFREVFRILLPSGLAAGLVG